MQTLRDIVSVARCTWPAFDQLHGKIESQLANPTAFHLTTIQSPSQPYQALGLNTESLDERGLPGFQGVMGNDSSISNSLAATSSLALTGNMLENQDMTDAPELRLGA